MDPELRRFLVGLLAAGGELRQNLGINASLGDIFSYRSYLARHMLPSIARGGLLGGLAGAVPGYLLNDDSREGALLGGLLGSLGGTSANFITSPYVTKLRVLHYLKNIVDSSKGQVPNSARRLAEDLIFGNRGPLSLTRNRRLAPAIVVGAPLAAGGVLGSLSGAFGKKKKKWYEL